MKEPLLGLTPTYVLYLAGDLTLAQQRAVPCPDPTGRQNISSLFLTFLIEPRSNCIGWNTSVSAPANKCLTYSVQTKTHLRLESMFSISALIIALSPAPCPSVLPPAQKTWTGFETEGGGRQGQRMDRSDHHGHGDYR